MADVKWIKIVTDIFDDEKMLLIESLPSADSLIVIWFKLLCLAGKNNNSGVFLLNDRIPYTDEMLSSIFRRDVNTVRLALKTFEDFGMIEVVEGVITIPNWGKHQTLDRLEKKTEYMKKYMRDYRQKQKDRIECKTNSNSNSNSNVSSADIDNKDKDNKDNKDKKDLDNLSNTNVLDCPTQSDEKRKYIFEEETKLWNELQKYGIAAIRGITPGSNRAKYLKARLAQYGIDSFREIVEAIKQSDFLQGKHSGRPWQVTFDWVILPSNYPKVIEGNYKNSHQHTGSQFDLFDIGE